MVSYINTRYELKLLTDDVLRGEGLGDTLLLLSRTSIAGNCMSSPGCFYVFAGKKILIRYRWCIYFAEGERTEIVAFCCFCQRQTTKTNNYWYVKSYLWMKSSLKILTHPSRAMTPSWSSSIPSTRNGELASNVGDFSIGVQYSSPPSSAEYR